MRTNRTWPPATRGHGPEGERGQILVLMAGGLVAMLLVVGLVIDTGVAFKERRGAQNISDLAALAGTRIVADWYLDPSAGLSGADVYDAIDESVTINGCIAPCTWTADYVQPHPDYTTTSLGPVADSGDIPSGAQGVAVTTNRNPETYFIRLVGMDHWDVGASATASTSRLPQPPPGVLLPLAIFDADYQVGQAYQLTVGDEGPGNFGWLNWNDTPPFNDVMLRNSVCTPDNPAFLFPEWFEGSTGAKNDSTLRACLDAYIANQTVVYIPLWQQVQDPHGIHLQYEIVGVAAFVLTSYTNPAVNTITGRFVEFYSYPGVPAGFGLPPCSATTDPTDCDERTNFIGLIQ